MEPNHISAGQLKTKKVIHNEFMEWLQKKRRATQRRPVKLFPLLVAQCFFYDLNTKSVSYTHLDVYKRQV